jgi:hypothetical protein
MSRFQSRLVVSVMGMFQQLSSQHPPNSHANRLCGKGCRKPRLPNLALVSERNRLTIRRLQRRLGGEQYTNPSKSLVTKDWSHGYIGSHRAIS